MISFNNLGNLGRFGNQLFQVAAIIGTAEKNNTNYCIPPWKYNTTIFKNQVPCKSGRGKIYVEPSFSFNEITGDNLDLKGYFQSEKYFKHCEDLIRYHFTFNQSIENYLKQYEKYFTDDYCSIHVRRGDYLKSKYHNALPLEYFKKAMEHFEGKKFLVFSDDLKWCKDNLKGCDFVEPNKEVYDFAIMSRMKNHIISNSSFSWWASWLANSNKTVAPAEWFGVDGQHLDTKDLYLDQWIKI